MKELISIALIFLCILTNAQEQKKFEHWDDRYNSADESEIKKSEEFFRENNLVINRIINQTFGVCKYTKDSLPYIESFSNDTLIYFMPGGESPIERSELELDENGKIVGHDNCYIGGINKDGRISIRTPHRFSFLIKDSMIYAFVSYQNKSDEEIKEIFSKFIEAKTDQEKVSFLDDYKKCYTEKAEQIVDLKNKNSLNDTIKIDNEKHSRIIDIYEKGDIKYFEIKLNFDPYRGRRSLTFTIDENLRLIRLEEFKLYNN